MHPLYMYMYMHTEYNVGSILKLSRHINSDFSRQLIARLSVMYIRNELKLSLLLMFRAIKVTDIQVHVYVYMRALES